MVTISLVTSGTSVVQQKYVHQIKSVSIGATVKEIKSLKYSLYILYGEAILLHDFEVDELTTNDG